MVGIPPSKALIDKQVGAGCRFAYGVRSPDTQSAIRLGEEEGTISIAKTTLR